MIIIRAPKFTFPLKPTTLLTAWLIAAAFSSICIGQSIAQNADTLLQAYKYTFRQLTVAQASTLQALDLNTDQQLQLQHAAFVYAQAHSTTQSIINAIIRSDWASHPQTKHLSFTARTNIHMHLAKLRKNEFSIIDTLHSNLDTTSRQQFDKSIAAYYSNSVLNISSSGELPAALISSSESTLRTSTATQPKHSSIQPMAYRSGGGNLCPYYDSIDEEYEIDENCADAGGMYNLENCSCDTDYVGGGGGGYYPADPIVTDVSPSSVLVTDQSDDITISGTRFGTSPVVNLPTGVSISNQNSSDSQITATLTWNNNVSVGNISISVTTDQGTSNSASLIFDGPYQMKVISDTWGLCEGCKTTIQRVIAYQIINFSGSDSGASTVCETPTRSGWSCNQPEPTVSANFCSSSPYDSYDGTFRDTWTLSSDNLAPSGCGVNINDPWYWAYTSSPTPIGTPAGYIHTDAIQIDDVTTPSNIPAGTIMPK
jgi:hypothetical protein